MKSRIYFLVLVSFLVTMHVGAQNENDVIATIGGVPILRSEFEYAYDKKDTQANIKNNQTPEQFLNSYIDFKINVIEAKNKGIDKSDSFQKEYNGYVNQLLNSYVSDSIFDNDWIKELYRRLGENYEIINVFIPFAKSKNLQTTDTVAAYNTAIALRKMIKNDGSNFEKAVQQYSSSKTSADNHVLLGNNTWIGALMADQNYEDAIFNLDVDQVSQPIRTRYGYYLVKVLNRRPDEGMVRISDIYMKYPQNATQAQKDSVDSLASSLYEKLLNGVDFDTLSQQYTTDFDPETRGDLGFFSIRRLINPTFQDAMKNLSVGDYTKPFFFGEGIHLVNITDVRNFGSFEKMKPQIVERLKDVDFINEFYAHESKAAKQKIDYTINQSAYNQLIALANKSSLCEIDPATQNISLITQQLFVVGEKKYTVGDFLNYLTNNRKDICSIYTLSSDVLYYGLSRYLYTALEEEYKQQLLTTNEQLKNITNEYYDGILFFDIMSTELWDKAQTDKNGLEQFFEANKSQYKWDKPRYEGYLIFAKDKNIEKEAKSIIKKNGANGNLGAILKESLNDKENINIVVEKGFWSKGENPYIDALKYGVPTTNTFIGYPVFFFEGKKIEQPRNMNDIRGLVVTDYQTELDSEWISKLKGKYEIVINKDVLNNISTK